MCFQRMIFETGIPFEENQKMKQFLRRQGVDLEKEQSLWEKISKNPIIEIVSEGDKLAVLDNAGRLFFLSIQ